MAQGYSFKLQTGPQGPGFFTGDPLYFVVGDDSSSIIETAYLYDDAFDYFPYASLAVNDQSGTLAATYPFMESLGMNMEISLDSFTNKLNHNFYWRDSQLPQTILSDHVSGSHIWTAVSELRKKDSVKSRAFGVDSSSGQGLPWKTIINSVIAPYGFTSTVMEGNANSLLLNTDFEYQLNETDFEFVNRLSERASSVNNSPFLSFINLQGEFYFASLYTLLSQPVSKNLIFKMEISDARSFLPDQIQNYVYQFGGLPVTESSYRSAMFHLSDDGTYVYRDKKLKDFFQNPQILGTEIGNSSNYVMMIRDAYTKELRDVRFYGLVDNSFQRDSFNGWMGQTVIDGLMCYKSQITVPFNADAVAGRTVELQINETAGSTKLSKLYGGKWLIYKSAHQWRHENRMAYSMLYLLKQGMEIDPALPEFPEYAANVPSPDRLVLT